MGSGSVGVAATRLSRDFAGNDIAEAAVDHSRSRLTPDSDHLDVRKNDDQQTSLALISA